MFTKTEITKEIEKIGTASGKLRDRIQTVSVSLIGHAFEHGDVTQADDLIRACGKQVDRQALVHYLEDFGPFRWVKAESRFKLNKKFRAENAFDEAHLNAEDTPKWYDYGRDTSKLASSFNVVTRITSVVKAAATAELKGQPVEDREFIAYVKNAIATYQGHKSEAIRLAFTEPTHADDMATLSLVKQAELREQAAA